MDTLFLLIFVVILFIVLATSWFAYQVLVSAGKREALRTLGSESDPAASPAMSVFIDRRQLEARATNNPLKGLIQAMGRRAASAGLDWSGPTVVTVSLACFCIGVVIGLLFPVLIFKSVSAVVLGLLFGYAPFGFISFRRSQRLAMFEEQFPEALDFIARALRAGHAFSVSLEMLSNDAPEPLSVEFRRIYQEQNLGAPLEVALTGLAERVPIIDVKFFVSAVLLQRESGGNLSEILTNLAHTVRERFRLKGHIKAVTAHARITALVLTAMPIMVLLILQIRNPEYLKGFLAFEEGPWLLLGGVLAQTIGYLFMRRLINFRI
jgi:tight adherence protein B